MLDRFIITDMRLVNLDDSSLFLLCLLLTATARGADGLIDKLTEPAKVDKGGWNKKRTDRLLNMVTHGRSIDEMAMECPSSNGLRRGCPEFCVNGASVNSSASFPQIEW